MKKEISVTKLKKKAWDIFSKYRRAKESNEDGYAYCVTCKDPKPLHWKKLQGGHFIPGRKGWIFFNEDCVWPQCYVCNIRLKGNWANYFEFMVKKFGHKKVHGLIALKNKEMSSTQMREECERIISLYGSIRYEN